MPPFRLIFRISSYSKKLSDIPKHQQWHCKNAHLGCVVSKSLLQFNFLKVDQSNIIAISSHKKPSHRKEKSPKFSRNDSWKFFMERIKCYKKFATPQTKICISAVSPLIRNFMLVSMSFFAAVKTFKRLIFFILYENMS